MCKTVGYDVNNEKNGLALPTCGQRHLNSYTDKKLKYGKLSADDKENVAFTIMKGLDMQWHVGHHDWVRKVDEDTDNHPHPENYDKLVKVKLRDIERELEKDGENICEPESGDSGQSVISDLNALSGEIKSNVKGWKKYYVSALSEKFAKKYR